MTNGVMLSSLSHAASIMMGLVLSVVSVSKISDLVIDAFCCYGLV